MWIHIDKTNADYGSGAQCKRPVDLTRLRQPIFTSLVIHVFETAGLPWTDDEHVSPN